MKNDFHKPKLKGSELAVVDCVTIDGKNKKELQKVNLFSIALDILFEMMKEMWLLCNLHWQYGYILCI